MDLIDWRAHSNPLLDRIHCKIALKRDTKVVEPCCTGDGSIIATIITSHMPRNDAAAAGQVCPGIRIHAMDIVQPPGIGIPPIADMEPQETMVTVALAAKASAETPQNAPKRPLARSIIGPVP